MKQRFSNTIDSHARPTQTGSGCSTEFLISVAGWYENHHTKLEVCSHYTFQVTSALKWKSWKYAIWSLSHILSHLTTQPYNVHCTLTSAYLRRVWYFVSLSSLLPPCCVVSHLLHVSQVLWCNCAAALVGWAEDGEDIAVGRDLFRLAVAESQF